MGIRIYTLALPDYYFVNLEKKKLNVRISEKLWLYDAETKFGTKQTPDFKNGKGLF